jgi:hypothetical protein
MIVTAKTFPVDGGFGFLLFIGPEGREPKPFPWNLRSWDTEEQAQRAGDTAAQAWGNKG